MPETIASARSDPHAGGANPARERRMAASHRYANLAAVALPAGAIVTTAVLTWGEGVDATDLVVLVIAYALAGLGITVGFHRLLTHRALIAPRWLELSFAVPSKPVHGRTGEGVVIVMPRLAQARYGEPG